MHLPGGYGRLREATGGSGYGMRDSRSTYQEAAGGYGTLGLRDEVLATHLPGGYGKLREATGGSGYGMRDSRSTYQEATGCYGRLREARATG